MSGFQGYIASCEFEGNRVPQHVQNIVIRDYCAKNNMRYLLSGTEYAIKNSFLILDQMLETIDQLEGIVAYSLFLLPTTVIERNLVYQKILRKNKQLHFAVESLSIRNHSDIRRIDDIWAVHSAINGCILKRGKNG